MRLMILIIAAFLAMLTGLFLFALPVYATDPPDANPSIYDIRANINLIETGDVLIYGEYNIPYTSLPEETADETYNFRLIDTDNVTQLGAIVPFVQFDSGFNEGGFAFYFSAADNITTDQAYIIRISQSPAHFASPQSWDYQMPLSGWTSSETREDNQIELAINVISLAQSLEAAHEDVTLLESSAGGTVLSDPTGERYFRGVIYGIQLMAPELFLVQVLTLETADRLWTTTQFDEYEEELEETWVGESTANTSATYGLTTPALMTMLYILPICLGFIIISVIKFKKAEPGYVVSALVLILGALIGWLPTALFATLYQLMAIYIGYLWFYARS